MHALIENTKKSPYLHTWLQYAALSYERFKKVTISNTNLTPCNLLSRINILQQLDNLKTYPVVLERLQNNKLRIHGWWFDLVTANVYYCDQKTDTFVLIEDKTAENILNSF